GRECLLVTRNLRICLTILSIGFAIEGAGEVYTRFFAGSAVPGASVLYLLPLVLTALGLLFVWVGREEWNQVHLVRVRTANRVFAYSLLGAVIGAAVLGLLIAVPSLGAPLWAEAVFGAAVGSLVFGTFVTYAYLVFHLVSDPGRVVVVLSLVWAFFISALVGISIGAAVPTILSIINDRTLSVPAFVSPVEVLVSSLFVSYFLLLAVYIEAHVAVARGLITVPNRPGVPVSRQPAPKDP
ncbi:MAG: hypothetical protein L3K02_05465, partial [Thermoplasmata archaeon]|nr:hypothetical protein [Thermoplasmata archaeon]